MTQEQAGLHEQALNKAAELGLASQLDEVEQLQVDVQADPLKLLQGQVDKIAIAGEGLVMKQDLRMEQVEVQTTRVAINPLLAACGQIELSQPTDATVRVVLTEPDLNRAFASEYITQKLQNLVVHLQGEPITVDAQQVDLHLPGDGKIALSASVLLRETGQTHPVAFTAVPQVPLDGCGLKLEEVQYGEEKELSPGLTAALVEKVDEILNFRNFELGGMSLQIERLDVEEGKLTLHAKAYVEQIPTAA